MAWVRCGCCSTKRFPTVVGSKLRDVNAPVGKDPCAKVPEPYDRSYGRTPVLWWVYCQERGRTSKIPKPPRTAVLPLRNGSHAKPTRGWKLRRVWFEAQRVFTGVSAMLVRVVKTAKLLWASVGRGTGS